MYEANREQAVLDSGALQRTRDPDLEAIVAFTAARYRTFFAGLSILTGRRQVLLATVGLDIVETLREESFCATTIQRPGEPLIVPDAKRDKRFATLPAVIGEPFIRFYAGVPIMDQQGFALGALCIASREARHGPFDPTDLILRSHEVERMLHW